MLTKADWQAIWDKFDLWFAEQSGGGPDWWSEQKPQIERLVDAQARQERFDFGGPARPETVDRVNAGQDTDSDGAAD